MDDLLRSPVFHKLAGSAILLLVVVALRSLIRRAVLRHVTQPEARLRWLVNIRNGLLLLFVLSLISIWAEALRTLAVSVVAIAVASVIATKELILCVSGYVLRTTNNVYSVGDRIEVGNCRGDVIDHSMLTTTILEIGPGRHFHMHTGRTVVFPNSLLVSTPVINESSMERYVVHVFSIPLKVDEDWHKAEMILLEEAQRECGPFLEEARSHMAKLERTQGFSSPSADPRVAVHLPEPGQLRLLMRIPTPVGRQGRIEQAILRRFLERFYPVGQGAPESSVVS